VCYDKLYKLIKTKKKYFFLLSAETKVLVDEIQSLRGISMIIRTLIKYAYIYIFTYILYTYIYI